MSMSAAQNRFKQARAPEGLQPAAPGLLEQGRTGDSGEASREPRPARPREDTQCRAWGPS